MKLFMINTKDDLAIQHTHKLEFLATTLFKSRSCQSKSPSFALPLKLVSSSLAAHHSDLCLIVKAFLKAAGVENQISARWPLHM
jgi:hypothetical protein